MLMLLTPGYCRHFANNTFLASSLYLEHRTNIRRAKGRSLYQHLFIPSLGIVDFLADSWGDIL